MSDCFLSVLQAPWGMAPSFLHNVFLRSSAISFPYCNSVIAIERGGSRSPLHPRKARGRQGEAEDREKEGGGITWRRDTCQEAALASWPWTCTRDLRDMQGDTWTLLREMGERTMGRLTIGSLYLNLRLILLISSRPSWPLLPHQSCLILVARFWVLVALLGPTLFGWAYTYEGMDNFGCLTGNFSLCSFSSLHTNCLKFFSVEDLTY